MKNQQKVKISIKIGSKKSLVIMGLITLWLLTLLTVWFYSGKIGNGSELLAARRFPLLNPRLRNLSQEERSSKAFTTLVPLRDKLNSFLGDDARNSAFYVEDLNTGAWTGIKEKEEFIPASLLKVPVAIGVMKKIDNGDWSMDKKFPIEEKYKDKNFGDLWKSESGTELTVDELLKQMLQKSDNTASNILFFNLSPEDRDEVYYHIGVSNPEAANDNSAGQVSFKNLTPRNLATFFRALYNATYLTRESSNYLLELLTKTEFDQDISGGIPANIKIAHKMAAFYDESLQKTQNYHDCGITLYPGHPYLYCLLTKDLKPDLAQKIINGMSGIVYQYFEENSK